MTTDKTILCIIIILVLYWIHLLCSAITNALIAAIKNIHFKDKDAWLRIVLIFVIAILITVYTQYE